MFRTSWKLVVATAILLLEQDGKLSTGDPLSRFMPDYPNATNITSQQLLNHTSAAALPDAQQRRPAPSLRAGSPVVKLWWVLLAKNELRCLIGRVSKRLKYKIGASIGERGGIYRLVSGHSDAP